MQKNSKDTNQEIFDAKLMFKKYAKRAIISMLFTFPFAVVVSVFLGKKTSEWVIAILIIVIFLLGFVIGQLIYAAIDKKNAKKPKDLTKERDPFSD